MFEKKTYIIDTEKDTFFVSAYSVDEAFIIAQDNLIQDPSLGKKVLAIMYNNQTWVP